MHPGSLITTCLCVFVRVHVSLCSTSSIMKADLRRGGTVVFLPRPPRGKTRRDVARATAEADMSVVDTSPWLLGQQKRL